MINIAFRADGSERIGMGHIMRCLALAGELQEYPVNIRFFSRNNEKVLKLIQEAGIQTVIIQGDGLAQELAEIETLVKKYDIKVLITDSYEITADYLDEIKKDVSVLVSIDDLNPMIFPSDVVINGNLYANELQYQSKYGNTKFLLGPQYVLVRSEFSDVPSRKIRSQAEKVLVTVGGSDGFNLTPQILKTLDTAAGKLKITVIIGPNYSNIREIKDTASQLHQEVILLENIKNMKNLMLDCDLAITAGGSTLYELAITGTPAVVILQAENQILGAEKLAAHGSVINLGLGNRDFSGLLKNAITMLIENYNLRKKMSCLGQGLVDGQGCRRCAGEIMNLVV